MTSAGSLALKPDTSFPISAINLAIASVTVLASYFWLRSNRQIRTGHMMDTINTSIVMDADVSQVFNLTELSQIITSFGDDIGPEGNFCKGRHGYTHYILDRPSSDIPLPIHDRYGNLIVMAHGLGNSVRAYKDLSKCMTAIGYYVLRYDFFGHGYSKYGSEDMWMEYSSDMLIDQLEDVLDHVIKISSPTLNLKLSTFVGHSTGGILGIAASARWSQSLSTINARYLPRIVLLSPAIWAAKPIVAQIADRIPRTLTSLIKNISSLRVLITDAFTDSLKIAFAKDPDSKKYIYAAQEEETRLLYNRLLGKEKGVPPHPFFHAAVLGLNCHTLRADLLPKHRGTLVQILKDTSSLSAKHILFVWGDLDFTVPYNKNIATAQKWMEEYPKLEIKVMNRMAHELLAEDSDAMAGILKAFLEKSQ